MARVRSTPGRSRGEGARTTELAALAGSGAAERARSRGRGRPRRGEVGSAPVTDEADKGTRDQILDVALDLFIEKGYEKSSLREIAEQMGFSKAALYYHFASKDDILMALHMRLHSRMDQMIAEVGDQTVTLEYWAALLDQIIEGTLADRKLFVLHARNQAAFEGLHASAAPHEESHNDMEALFRRTLADTSIPLRDRVRMGCSFGALMGGLLMTGGAFQGVDTAELTRLLQESIRDLLGV